MLIKNLMVYSNTDRSFYEADILIENGIIKAIGNISDGEGQVMDGKGAYVVPGLIDVHTHGIGGYDWGSVTDGEMHTMAGLYASHGVTSVMPTLGTDTYENMLASTDAVNRFEPLEGESYLCGMHWEGRYLNTKKKGAHREELIASLDASELDRDVLRSCKALHISASYELDADGSFSRMAKEIGATLGLGHTMATYVEAKTAESRGVTSYTHLYNAMPPLHHRDGGCIAAAFEGEAFAEIICDGIHISPEMVRLAYRNLGAERLTLVSDSLSTTGVPDGQYVSLGLDVIVKDGSCRLLDGTLAGSTITLDRAVRNLAKFCGIPVTEAIICATQSPAKQMGIFDKCGSIDVGKRADMLFLSDVDSFEIRRVMVGGSFASK